MSTTSSRSPSRYLIFRNNFTELKSIFFSEMNFLSGMNGLGFILVGESDNDIHIFSDPLVLFPIALVSPGSYAATHVFYEESYLEVGESALSWSMLGMMRCTRRTWHVGVGGVYYREHQLQTWLLQLHIKTPLNNESTPEQIFKT